MTQESQQEFELQFLKGIGPKRAEILSKSGIDTRRDLLNYFPRKYVDRTSIVGLDTLQADQEVTVVGKIEVTGIKRYRKPVFYMVISDGKGILEAVWFNGINYFKKLFQIGEWVSLSGKISFYRGYQMVHPDYDRLGSGEIEKLVNTGKIIAFYRESEIFKKTGINSYTFRNIFNNLFEKGVDIRDPFPETLIQERRFQSLTDAYCQIHLPDSRQLLNGAMYRLKYQEFFFLQLLLALQRANIKSKPVGIPFTKSSPGLHRLYEQLPFEMTGAQKRVVREIREDMKKSTPMNRLLQGDVGSGKTLVALMAMLIAIDNGCQTALMVPTEILAEQHYININRLLNDLAIPIHLFTGSKKKDERDALFAEIKTGKPCIIIGTHTLIQESVSFSNLGLVVIDEQHRFGVMQRGNLMAKGLNPDVLIMTATPIPRTLALTAYGSLDVSLIDELPASRQPIQTVWRFDDQSEQIYQFVREHVDQGEQAYIIYPLVEESESMDLKAATEGFVYLKKGPFKGYNIGLLHGRMKSEEKETVMRRFTGNEIQILVSTIVVEVGVDVANATIMLIEHSERFGLAQLHQLRGRIGRGSQKSFCILKTPYNVGEVAQQRLKIMTETNDGFVISEKDLTIRGWGDFHGTKQSGMPDFKIANPIVDRDILIEAREDAFRIVAEDPLLRRPENAGLNHAIRTEYKERMELINIS